MVKKIVLFVVLVLIAAVMLARTFAKDVPFVKRSNEIAAAQLNKINASPLGLYCNKYWTKTTDYFKRLNEKTNCKKTAELPAPTTKIKKKPTPKKSFKDSKGKGSGKSTTKRIWKDDKGTYDWKDEKENYDWRR